MRSFLVANINFKRNMSAIFIKKFSCLALLNPKKWSHAYAYDTLTSMVSYQSNGFFEMHQKQNQTSKKEQNKSFRTSDYLFLFKKNQKSKPDIQYKAHWHW